MIDIEDEVTRHLQTTASEAEVRPDLDGVKSGLRVVTLGPTRSGSNRRSALLVAAAAVIVATVGIAALQTRSQDVISTGSQPSPSDSSQSQDPERVAGVFVFETPQVTFAADEVLVATNGRTFTPNEDVSVNGDLGRRHEYTTLELSWSEADTPMRIYMYFTSDGTDWWSHEIRTYDGSPGGEWATEQTGEFFRSPLGEPYEGDFQLGTLTLSNLRLEAFVDPTSCEGGSGGAVLVPSAASIDQIVSEEDSSSGPAVGGYGLHVTILDTATCTPIADISAFDIQFTSGDITTVEVSNPDPVDSAGRTRVDLSFYKPGSTTLTITLLDADGKLVDSINVPIQLN